MFGIGMSELVVILVVALIVFGPEKLPEIGKSLGRGVREFKKAVNEFKQAMDVDTGMSNVKKAFDQMNEVVKDPLELKQKPEKKTELTASAETLEKVPEEKVPERKETP